MTAAPRLSLPRVRGDVVFAFVSLLGVAYGLVVVFVLAQNGPDITAYATRSRWAAVVALTAGLGLVTAAGLTRLDRTAGSVGPPLVALSVAWLAPVWVGWSGGPPVVRSVAMVVAPFVAPAMLHLTLSAPDGRLAGTAARAVVVSGYASTAAVSLGTAVARDPFLDPYCWNNCDVNSLLLQAHPAFIRTLGTLWLFWSSGLGILTVALAVGRLGWATAAGRSARWMVLVPVAAAASGDIGYVTLLWRDPAESPAKATFLTVFVVRGVCLSLLAIGVVGTVIRGSSRRRGLARLIHELDSAPAPGFLRAALARSLGDPDLDIDYWLPESGRFVDTAGRPSEPEPTRERAMTTIYHGGELVAAVRHDRGLYRSADLAELIGSATRLAIDNERLRAALFAQLDDLRASRGRVIAAGDAARRQLERDLHDGAQQHLLAVGYEVRLARASADPMLGDILDSAAAAVRSALEDLREIAYGIFPAVLDEAGLGPALWSLTDRAPMTVDLDGVPDERLPAPVERVAYLVISGVVAAAGDDVAALAVRMSRSEHVVIIDIEGSSVDVGAADAGRYVQLSDRVGALGGRLVSQPGHLRAEIPCG
jgi:signal transduction histidine kinase